MLFVAQFQVLTFKILLEKREQNIFICLGLYRLSQLHKYKTPWIFKYIYYSLTKIMYKRL